MRASTRLIGVGFGLVLCCAGCAPDAKPPAPAPAPKPPPPAPPPPAPPKLLSANDLPPRHVVKADGIVITEYVDGRVNVKTTMAWGEVFDTSYDSCVYYRGALPVLRRQLIPERAKALDGVCALSPAEAKAEAKAQAKAAKAAKVAELAAKAAQRKAGVAKKP